jgi:hypothetical protein
MCNITHRTRDAERAIAGCADRLGIHEKQIRLGLSVDDFESAHEAVIRLGVRVLKPAAGATVGDDFQVSARSWWPSVLFVLLGGGRVVSRTDESSRPVRSAAEQFRAT